MRLLVPPPAISQVGSVVEQNGDGEIINTEGSEEEND